MYIYFSYVIKEVQYFMWSEKGNKMCLIFSLKSELLILWKKIMFKRLIFMEEYEQKTQLRARWLRAPLYFNDRSSQPPWTQLLSRKVVTRESCHILTSAAGVLSLEGRDEKKRDYFSSHWEKPEISTTTGGRGGKSLMEQQPRICVGFLPSPLEWIRHWWLFFFNNELTIYQENNSTTIITKK